MGKNDMVFNSIEEMVSYVVNASQWQLETRWKLEEWSHMVYDDPEYGQKWNEEWNALYGINDSHPEYEKLMEKKQFLNENRPSMHQEVNYSLYHRDRGGWRGTTIGLSNELGETLNDIWTKKPRYKGSDALENFGAITLTGILKRLGKTDISKRIAESQQKEKARLEKLSRNNIRNNIREQAKKLHEYLDKKGQEVGVNTGVDLQTLMNLQDEE